MFKCLLERLFPSHLQLNARNTVFYTALSKRFNIKAKTTNSRVGDTSPSKHETMGGTAYRNLAVCAFPVEDRIPPEERPGPVAEEDREAYGDWLFLSKHSNDNKAVLPTLNFDHAMVVEWFKNWKYYSPPKKHQAGNWPPFPALLFMTRPYRDHRVLRALHRLQLDSGWSMERLHQAEDRALPAFDRVLSNTSLLLQIVVFLLGGCGKLVATGRKDPPPPNANLVLGVYADGYRPRGRGNVNTKVCVIDMEGSFFPHVNHVPQCSTMVTWREMLKNAYDQWVREGRTQELNRLRQTPFTLLVKWQGHTSNTLVCVTFRLLTTGHHHLWWECGGRCCVVCPWKRHEGVRALFGCHTQSLQQMGKMFVGVEGLEEAFVVQPSLHNLKGGISRACGVVGRVLPLEDACELFRYVATVAPRYKVADIPVDSKQYCSLVRRRFRNGISFTGREAREFLALVAQDCVLPLPFHLLFLSYSHIVVLLYASDTCLPQGEWGAWGNLHVYSIHLILEYAESGSTATLYLHGLSHAFARPHLPIQFSDEAGERDLRLGKTFATLTTTCLEHSIRATLSHELYMKFTDRKLRWSQARLWKPVRRGVVLE